MSKIVVGLATILVLISSAMLPSIIMANSSSSTTYFMDYSINYHSYHSGKYFTTSCKESLINLNITSTKIGNNKYNNTIIVTGYIFTNYSSPFMTSVSNKTIHHVFNFTSKYPLAKEITIFNLSSLLNMTLNITNEFKIFNITVNYKINYQPNGTESVVFNGKQYTLDSYKAFLYLSALGKNKYANITYTSTMIGNILTFQKGILYKLYLTGESQKNITFYNFLNTYSKGNETLCILLKNTNIKLDSVMMPNQENVNSTQQESIKPEEFLIPTGIIGLLAAALILVRKF
ncbi:hypothetical protein Ahos_1021 [Acidianus hospitalis W1]|uniref:Uncharacterized protein n=1 Tax=Acidianus hospitalis (strain W1) TaxID=933801 RepID=F4B9B4_ACIHW|nr:hypothetical protein [Acidianus hospitalis]AEE93907.1 hypothetical protein Ahos_1021 [Acidianus hospitalis W1]